jgi:hypothetical protein
MFGSETVKKARTAPLALKEMVMRGAGIVLDVIQRGRFPAHQ